MPNLELSPELPGVAVSQLGWMAQHSSLNVPHLVAKGRVIASHVHRGIAAACAQDWHCSKP